MEKVIEFLVNNGGGVALIFLIVALLTALKQFFKRVESADVPRWLQVSSHVAEKILEFITANDGQSDQD